MRFHRDGYDYIATKNNTTFCISSAYGVWWIWVNDEEQKDCFDYLEDAKEFCRNYKV